MKGFLKVTAANMLLCPNDGGSLGTPRFMERGTNCNTKFLTTKTYWLGLITFDSADPKLKFQSI
jgi:hypothetical protein